ncbi:MAG: hypothetical protein NUV80_00325 [Candidatus Berkelbacteria bacterium]|nr:hypothetical protein [Candidatus Berkelbacteria bacterium]
MSIENEGNHHEDEVAGIDKGEDEATLNSPGIFLDREEAMNEARRQKGNAIERLPEHKSKLDVFDADRPAVYRILAGGEEDNTEKYWVTSELNGDGYYEDWEKRREAKGKEILSEGEVIQKIWDTKDDEPENETK